MNDYLMPTYPQPQAVFERGSGVYLYDSEGRRYLDFLAGIAVVSLGHCHPRIKEAIATQSSKLMQVSNFFTTEATLAAAYDLVNLVGWPDGKVFFANSGAEANEAAIKLLRKARPGGVIVTFSGAFHGRTLGALSATGDQRKKTPFEPLLPGFLEVAFNDASALAKALSQPEVSSVLLEVVQGEAGVYPLSPDVAEVLRTAQRQRGVLVVVDEVQTGMGRTGEWFGYRHFGLEPDAITLAKALGNGFPVAALVARGELGEAFSPGDHGSTFGGNPLASAVVSAVIEEMKAQDMPMRSAQLGLLLAKQLRELPGIKQVEGLGLMIGAELEKPLAKQVVSRALSLGLILNTTGPSRLRLLPPLIINEPNITEGLELLRQAIEDVWRTS
jgi:predicted acetylornithine/succinylornithine family transaminase